MQLSKIPEAARVTAALSSLLILFAWTVLGVPQANGQQLQPPPSIAGQPLPPQPAATQPLPPQPNKDDPDAVRKLLLYTQDLEKRVQQLESKAVVPPTSDVPVAPVVGSVPTDSQATNFLRSLFPDNQIPFAVGGQYRIMGNASNFQNHSTTLSTDQPLDGFANQRFRTWMTVSPNENVQAYIQVQMGSVLLGANNDFSKTFAAPLSLSNDQVGIMLRRAFLSYQSEGIGRIRVGIQDFSDSFGDTLASADWDFNVGGIAWDKTFKQYNDLKLQLGAYLLAESGALNSANAYLIAFDATQPLSDKFAAGFSVYYLPDFGNYSYPTLAPYQSAQDVWLGWRFKGETACIPWNTFVIWNYGERLDEGTAPVFIHSGAAAKFEVGAVDAGPGKFSMETLVSTGGHQGNNYSSEFRTVAQSEQDNFGSQGYWGYLPLISPYGPTDVNDMGVGLQNRGLGLFTVQGKYAMPLTPWLTSTFTGGYLRSMISNPVSNSHDMGMELAQTFTITCAKSCLK